MLSKLFSLAAVLLLCSSCVSRTVYKESGLKGETSSGKPVAETKLIWIWDKEFRNP